MLDIDKEMFFHANWVTKNWENSKSNKTFLGSYFTFNFGVSLKNKPQYKMRENVQ
jgi:hypothetical protein